MLILPIKKSVKVNPSKIIYIPNDRFAKKLFNLSDEDFRDACQEPTNLVEIKNHKKLGTIRSPFLIIVDEQFSFTLSEPLDQFDFDVLIICISEYHAGNYFITPAIIYRGLTGKIGRGDAEPSKDQLAAIMHSLEKLMFLKIEIFMNELCEKADYNAGKKFHIVAPILPAEYLTETIINGKSSTVIHLLEESPIWRIACLKNHQVLSFNSELLNIPRQQNTKLNIMVKFYVLRRVLEIIHHNLTSTITFLDVFKNCRIENADNKTKLRAREFMLAFFKHLKTKKIIKSFELTKKGNTFYSIKFTYSKPKKKS